MPGQSLGIAWRECVTAVAFPQMASNLALGTPDEQGRTARGGDTIL